VKEGCFKSHSSSQQVAFQLLPLLLKVRLS
jgi:hypothetical protein